MLKHVTWMNFINTPNGHFSEKEYVHSNQDPCGIRVCVKIAIQIKQIATICLIDRSIARDCVR